MLLVFLLLARKGALPPSCCTGFHSNLRVVPYSQQQLLGKGVDKQRVFLLLHMFPTRRFFLQLLLLQPGKALLFFLPPSPLRKIKDSTMQLHSGQPTISYWILPPSPTLCNHEGQGLLSCNLCFVKRKTRKERRRRTERKRSILNPMQTCYKN